MPGLVGSPVFRVDQELGGRVNTATTAAGAFTVRRSIIQPHTVRPSIHLEQSPDENRGNGPLFCCPLSCNSQNLLRPFTFLFCRKKSFLRKGKLKLFTLWRSKFIFEIFLAYKTEYK